MGEWLKRNFIRIGAVALCTELISRFYFQVGIGWLSGYALRADWDIGAVDVIPHISTALDLVATLFWGLFSLGFALRMLAEFTRR